MNGPCSGPKFLSVATSWNCRAAPMKVNLSTIPSNQGEKNEELELNGKEQQYLDMAICYSESPSRTGCYQRDEYKYHIRIFRAQ